MISDVQILVCSAFLLWLMLMTASALRTQGWTPGGIERAFGNRDDLPAPNPIAGRADRAAKNMLENFVIFIALVAALHFAGNTSGQAQLGANLFFWGRVAFWPIYLAGIVYLRTAAWGVSIVGLIMMAASMW
jgi:uncharacterized MAPEG superfamily protein